MTDKEWEYLKSLPEKAGVKVYLGEREFEFLWEYDGKADVQEIGSIQIVNVPYTHINLKHEPLQN